MLVGKLKAAQTAYSEEELNTMDIDGLEKLATIAKVDVSEGVSANSAVDFSGRGLGRPQQTVPNDKPPAPPSFVDAVKANTAKKGGQAAS